MHERGGGVDSWYSLQVDELLQVDQGLREACPGIQNGVRASAGSTAKFECLGEKIALRLKVRELSALMIR
jgi:hypothetical protein